MKGYYWADLLRPIFRDQDVIVTGDTVSTLLPTARLVRRLGAKSTFILGTHGNGAGQLPQPEDGKWLAIEPPRGRSLVESLHLGLRQLNHLPKNALDAIEKYDPNAKAIVLGTFLHEQPQVAGRKAFAYRRPEWLALEDHTLVDSLWDEFGVGREPSEVVLMNKRAILAAAKRLDRGNGTVWAGDARDGFQGGAEGTRWIRSEHDAEEAFDYLQTRSDRVRVMPFIEGIPCGIHGIVFPDYSAALRPIEIITLRRPDSGQFCYAGAASFWDPAPADREYMRNIARRAGDALRKMVNYRGFFTLDGIMTKDGFRPTELNPRSGAGVKTLVRGLPDVPVQLIGDALSAGIDLDWRPRELEELIVKAAGDVRGGGTWQPLTDTVPTIDSQPVIFRGGEWRWAKNHQPADAMVRAGDNPLGGFVGLTLDNDRTPKGPPVAQLARAFWNFVESEMGAKTGVWNQQNRFDRPSLGGVRLQLGDLVPSSSDEFHVGVCMAPQAPPAIDGFGQQDPSALF